MGRSALQLQYRNMEDRLYHGTNFCQVHIKSHQLFAQCSEVILALRSTTILS